MTYVPEPLDTSGVQIPAEIDALVEKLAEHIHDLWAVRRIQEGWRYGAERNDVKKTHRGWCPTASCPSRKRSMTARLRSGPSRSS